MKKILIALTVMAMTICFMGCVDQTDEPKTQLSNPLVEFASIDELNEAMGSDIHQPEGVVLKDEMFIQIKGTPDVGEYDFSVAGTNCMLRFAEIGAETDISGIYVASGSLFEGSDINDEYFENDDLKAQRWFEGDMQYILLAEDGGKWDKTQLQSLA